MSNAKTTKITERYYARIRADNAFAEVERAFNRSVRVHPDPSGSPTGGERPGRGGAIPCDGGRIDLQVGS